MSLASSEETAERLLLRDGKPISLTPKAFETLLVLVQSSGHAVEKDEVTKGVRTDGFGEKATSLGMWALRRTLRGF